MTTVNLPSFVRVAKLRAESFDSGDNSIEVCFTAGATVRRVSWGDGEYDEELIVTPDAVRLDRLNGGAPFLDSHNNTSLGSVIGSVAPGSARIQDGRGLARIVLSAASDCAAIVAKIVEGTVRNISCGYWCHRIEKTERESQVPLWRVMDWEPLEISAVPVPADPGAQIRSAMGLRPCEIVPARADRIAVIRTRMRMRQRAAGVRLNGERWS